MVDRQPWSVRGVAGEARAAAARAARKRRITIGAWVTQAVLDAARRDLAVQATPPAQEAVREDGGDAMLVRRIDRSEAVQAARMERLTAAIYGVMQAVEKNGSADDRHLGALAREQARLAERVAAMAAGEERRRRETGALIGHLAAALALLAARIDAAAGRGRGVPPAAIQGSRESPSASRRSR